MGLKDVLGVCLGVLDVPEGAVSLHSVARNRDEALGVYLRRGGRSRVEVLGVQDNRAFEVLCVSFLLRWGRDGVRAEEKAREIYDALVGLSFDGGFVKAVYDAPVWLGADGRGVFECVLDFDFYWQNEGIPRQARDDI